MRIAASAQAWVRRAARTEALLTTAVANTLTVGLGFGSGIATARGLSPAGRGVLFGTVLAGTILATLAVLGADEAIIFAAEGVASRAGAVRRSFGPALHRQSAVAAALLGAIVFVITRQSPASTRAVCVVAMVVMVPCGAYALAGAAVLRAAQQYRRWNAARLLPTVIYAGATVAMFARGWLTTGRGVVAFATGSAATALLVRHWLAGAERDEAQLHDAELHDNQATPDEVPRELRRYGAQVTILGAPYLINQRLDQFCLSLFVAPADLGQYSVAIALSAMLQIVAATLEQVLFPVLMARRDGHRRLATEALAATVVLTTAAAGALILAAPTLIRWLYGPHYASAAHPAQILLVGTVFVVCAAPLVAYGKSRDRVRSLIFAQAVAAGLTVVLLLPAVKAFGIAGAASVSSGAYALAFGVMLVQFLRPERDRPPAKRPRRTTVPLPSEVPPVVA